MTSSASAGLRARLGLASIGRRSLGITMLMITVVLWTACNFLASYIFSDDTYSKPFFIVYVNTSFFALSLVPKGLGFLSQNGLRGTQRATYNLWLEIRRDVRDWTEALRSRRSRTTGGSRADDDSANKLLGDDGDEDAGGVWRRRRNTTADDDSNECSPILATYAEAYGEGSAAAAAARDVEGGSGDVADLSASYTSHASHASAASVGTSSHHHLTGQLNFRETAWLSLEFCMLWFLANYFAAACLQYTSVASATIFTSLSSMFTLIFCAVAGVEPFSLRKFGGVLASLAGVALVSSVDLSGQSDEHRGQFPHKSPGEILAGDAMALLSAVVYGAYVTVMKHRVGHEDRVDMALFFGLVGLFNVVFLWPGFIVLHLTGFETFAMPPTGKVWVIILVNSFSSLFSDMSWAYAMLLTTPLVVTVGLSLTIPLSLIGEMLQYSQYSSGIYWVGACIVVLSFLFVNNESHEVDEAEIEEERTAAAGRH